MRTRYQQGRDTEYIAQRELLAMGWQSARMAGSKGKADIIAWNKHGLRYIQCKRYTSSAGSYTQDLAQLASLVLPPNASAELWVRQAGTHRWRERTLIQSTYSDKMDILSLDDLGRQELFVKPINPDPITQRIQKEEPWKTASRRAAQKHEDQARRATAKLAAQDLQSFINSHKPATPPASSTETQPKKQEPATPASRVAQRLPADK